MRRPCLLFWKTHFVLIRNCLMKSQKQEEEKLMLKGYTALNTYVFNISIPRIEIRIKILNDQIQRWNKEKPNNSRSKQQID